MPINRTQIARSIFSAAESMGISDRKQIESIIDRVIERLEQRSLPGMEDLVSDTRGKPKYLPSVLEIQSMVKEILCEEKKVKQEENQPKMQTAMSKTKIKPVEGINLTENSLHVLEKRYLKKDKTGKAIIKYPEDCMLCESCVLDCPENAIYMSPEKSSPLIVSWG